MFYLIPPQYRILAGFLALVLVLGGTFTYGYTKGHAVAAQEIAAYKARTEKIVADIQTKNAATKERIITQFVDKVRVVKQQEVVYRDRAVVSVPSQKNLSNGWIYLHDASVAGGDPDRIKSSDPSPSSVMDNQALAVVVSNYARCTQNAQQLQSLQNWINETKASTEKSQ